LHKNRNKKMSLSLKQSPAPRFGALGVDVQQP